MLYNSETGVIRPGCAWPELGELASNLGFDQEPRHLDQIFIPIDEVGDYEEINAELKRRAALRHSEFIDLSEVEGDEDDEPDFSGWPVRSAQTDRASHDWRISRRDRLNRYQTREERRWRFDQLVALKAAELDARPARKSWQKFCQDNPWAATSATSAEDFLGQMVRHGLDARKRCRELFGHDDVAKVLGLNDQAAA